MNRINRPVIRKKYVFWASLPRIIGILVLEILIYFILSGWGVFKIIAISDQIFLGLGALVIAFLFGRKKESEAVFLKRR